MMTWEPYFPSTAQQPTLEDIASGKYDIWIDKFAAEVRNANLPIAIRFAHEMNGRWYPWSEQEFGNKKGAYVDAWRHVHDRFDRANATNVIWVWSPNVIGSRPDLDLKQVYPGDKYVDWAGMSGYYRTTSKRGPSFDATFKNSLNAVRDVTKKKIVLTEIGAGTSSATDRADWITDVLQNVADSKDVIGFVYFEHDKHDDGSQDWRITSYPEAIDAFRRAVADPRYGAGGAPPAP
jgi:beta-mannanase